MEFIPYKSNETLENRYYQVPQELFENPLYKYNLNSDSKMLYAFILDRLSLSQKNHWIDKNNNIYLIFTRQELVQFHSLWHTPFLFTLIQLYCKIKKFFCLYFNNFLKRNFKKINPTFVRYSLNCFVCKLTLNDNFEIIATTTYNSLFLRVILVSRRKFQILWCNAFYSNCIHLSYLKLSSRIQIHQCCVETFHSCIFIHNAYLLFSM